MNAKHRPQSPRAEYYDWEMGFTSNPRDNWTIASEVRCNGIPIDSVTRCITGENGWIEYLSKDLDGQLIHDAGVVRISEIRGNVTVEVM